LTSSRARRRTRGRSDGYGGSSGRQSSLKKGPVRRRTTSVKGGKSQRSGTERSSNPGRAAPRVTPDIGGATFAVHDGRHDRPVYVSEARVGKSSVSFAPTRTFRYPAVKRVAPYADGPPIRKLANEGENVGCRGEGQRRYLHVSPTKAGPLLDWCAAACRPKTPSASCASTPRDSSRRHPQGARWRARTASKLPASAEESHQRVVVVTTKGDRGAGASMRVRVAVTSGLRKRTSAHHQSSWRD